MLLELTALMAMASTDLGDPALATPAPFVAPVAIGNVASTVPDTEDPCDPDPYFAPPRTWDCTGIAPNGFAWSIDQQCVADAEDDYVSCMEAAAAWLCSRLATIDDEYDDCMAAAQNSAQEYQCSLDRIAAGITAFALWADIQDVCYDNYMDENCCVLVPD